MNRTLHELIIGVALAALCSTASAQSWNVQLVDDSGDMGYNSRIVVLSDGTPVIAYRSSSSEFYLAWWVEEGGETGWNYSSLGTAWQIDMLIDADDHLHIAYAASSNTRYGIYDLSTPGWILGPEVVPFSLYDNRIDLTLWFDGGNVIPAIVGNTEGGTPRAAVRDPGTGTWTVGQITTTMTASGTSSIGVDSQGGLHVSFYEPSGDNLMYAVKVAGGTEWILQTVDVGGNIGQYSSILIDENDEVHIAYYDVTNGDLKYATTVLP